MIKSIFLSIVAITFISTLAHSMERKSYVSPDGKYHAIIVALPKAPCGCEENKVILKSKDGKTLCSKSYGSEDGEHGFGVEKAAWTPDSKFFVYSMSSSGGHQSWHYPVDFIAMIDCKIFSLDNLVGPITDPDFTLSDPDNLKAVGRDKLTLDEVQINASLKELMSRANKK